MNNSNKRLILTCVGDASDCALAHPEVRGDIREILEKGDIFLWNCEAPILAEGEKFPFSPRKFILDCIAALFGSKQPRVVSTPEIAELMRMGKTNVATLAANHNLDCGAGHIPRTIGYLQASGHHTLGVGTNKKEALKPLEITANGVKVGIVNYNRIGWNGPVVGYVDVYGAGPFWGGAAPFREKEAREKISRLRQNNDLVIAVLHLGRCNEETQGDKDRRIIEQFLEWGADLLLVHHSHAMGGVITTTKGQVALLGLGDFIFNCSPYPDYITFYFTLISWDEKRGFSVTGHPIIRENGIPRMATPEEGREISTRVKKLSRLEQGWAFEIEKEGAWRLFRE